MKKITLQREEVTSLGLIDHLAFYVPVIRPNCHVTSRQKDVKRSAKENFIRDARNGPQRAAAIRRETQCSFR
mgnify:CR=1 FL=1